MRTISDWKWIISGWVQASGYADGTEKAYKDLIEHNIVCDDCVSGAAVHVKNLRPSLVKRLVPRALFKSVYEGGYGTGNYDQWESLYLDVCDDCEDLKYENYLQERHIANQKNFAECRWERVES